MDGVTKGCGGETLEGGWMSRWEDGLMHAWSDEERENHYWIDRGMYS